MSERNIETQGSKKIKLYIGDLLRNKHFLNTVKKMLVFYNSRTQDDEVFELLKEYKKLDAKVKKYQNKYYSGLNKYTNILAEEYGLDMELLRPVLLSLSSLKEGSFKEALLYDPWQSDLCVVVDNNDECLNPAFPPIPFELNKRKQDHLKAFPISIDIHRFTTKRDLLDFIEKKWPWIENNLGMYREYKNVKIRKRKLDRKVTDFIWDNRELPAKKIKLLLDDKFPNNGLVYYEFSKIISQEERRRNRKIIVGQ